MHVLSLPPAFVLSQDQTLKLKSSFLTGHHSSRRVPSTSIVVSRLTMPGVLSKRDRQSVSPTPPSENGGHPQGLPPSTFLFLPIRLSNSSRPARRGRSPDDRDASSPRRTSRAADLTLKTKKRLRSPPIRGAAVDVRLIGPPNSQCQPTPDKNFHETVVIASFPRRRLGLRGG